MSFSLWKILYGVSDYQDFQSDGAGSDADSFLPMLLMLRLLILRLMILMMIMVAKVWEGELGADRQCPTGRVFQYRVGSGIGKNTG